MTLSCPRERRRDARERIAGIRKRLSSEGAELRCWIGILPPRDELSMGPLFGSAFGVKDCIDIMGRAPSLGMKRSPLRVAKADAEIVTALCNLGAEPIVATNMDELAIESRGANRFHGDVKNPTRPGELTGGSSGGSAAAVAAGLVDFALGTDFGGSTRIPGARCGLWALKLSAGAMTEGAHLIDETIDSLGLMTRSPEDMSRLCELLGLTEGEAEPRVAVPREEDTCGAEPSALSMLRAIAIARGLPAYEIPFTQAMEARKILGGRAFLRWLEALDIPENELSRAALATKIYGSRLTGVELDAAATERERVCGRLGRVFEHGFLLCPVLGDNERFLALANLCGVPALCFPCADFALQLVGPKGSEASLVRAARNLIRD